jgi:phospholipid/cholesterol/gamma-HCH transport system ATP-binding protein
MEVIRFENVVKRFGGETVLDGVSFEVRRGEVLAVIGPSGTGKSVALKHIVGLLNPTSGSVYVGGVEVSACASQELERVRSRIGYLFQSAALMAWLTVAENVALPLREKTSLSEEEISRKVDDALAAVELSGAADKYPSEISGGMQKRAGLARAIVRESDIVLYDEPTSGLDPVTSVTINALIRRLADERGITSVVVTHDLAGALKIADRVLLLKNGKVVECSPPDAFVGSGNRDVQEFLAAMKGETI